MQFAIRCVWINHFFLQHCQLHRCIFVLHIVAGPALDRSAPGSVTTDRHSRRSISLASVDGGKAPRALVVGHLLDAFDEEFAHWIAGAVLSQVCDETRKFTDDTLRTSWPFRCCHRRAPTSKVNYPCARFTRQSLHQQC